ncbi:hypothetical protein C8Q74DRAFT_1188006 [Fomes fomentarius]|nr:hypothetical protein C8Q74DRAFT_1188006 [Fomes fomentarius]
MSGRCEECGANTEWDQDIGSAICLQCGTLADPTQSVLASHLEYNDVSGREYVPWLNIPGSSTLRGRNGWALAGQGKEARDRQNTVAMHQFIQTLAMRLSSPGITQRAQGIFDQAMRVGQYRWGRRAKLTAGAALAIALRESRKSDSIHDIAYLLDVTSAAVSRAFSKVAGLLQVNMSLTDPAVHLPVLQAHLVSILNGSADGASQEMTYALPAQLTKVLLPLISRLPGIAHTASDLSTLITRTNRFTHLPTPPTACALFMLALEAELSSSLPNAGVFAQALGTRLGVGKVVVMERYKQIYDLVEEWIRDVPWLDAHERKKAKGKAGAGRSKVAKRVVVARGLKDVVQFQDDIWRKQIESGGRPVLQLDIDSKDGDASGDEWESSETAGSTSACQATRTPITGARPAKKVRTRHPRSVVDASHFLLNPLATAVPPRSSTTGSGLPDLLTHLLTADAASLPHAFARAPTRLQLLASERGGTDETQIADDELFAEDELEGYMRSPEEAAVVRTAMGWDADADRDDAGNVSERTTGEAGRGKKRKREEKDADEGTGKARGSKKIDMDALARLLDPDADLDLDSVGDFGAAVNVQCGAADEEVVEEWRPMSPGGGGGGSAEDWFDF